VIKNTACLGVRATASIVGMQAADLSVAAVRDNAGGRSHERRLSPMPRPTLSAHERPLFGAKLTFERLSEGVDECP